MQCQVRHPGSGAGQGTLTFPLPDPDATCPQQLAPKAAYWISGCPAAPTAAEESPCFTRGFRVLFSLELVSKTCGHNPSSLSSGQR